jgi:hypothetical protein
MLRILENVIKDMKQDPDTDPKNNHSGSTTLLLLVPSWYLFDFAILQEWGPEAVPVDQSWCNGCGQLFTGAADKKAYKCPACRQVRLTPPPLYAPRRQLVCI